MKPQRLHIKLLLFFSVFCIYQISYGQTCDIGGLPRFSVNSEVGCATFNIEVTDLSGIPNANYEYYGDGTGSITSSTLNAYTTAGNYTLTQTISQGNPRQCSMGIRVVESLEPKFRFFRCESNDVIISFPDDYYPQYHIDWGGGNTDIIDANGSIRVGYFNGSVVVKGIVKVGQGIAENSNSNCGAKTYSIDLSQPLPTVNIASIEIVDNKDVIVLYNSMPSSNYIIEKRNIDQPAFSTLDTLGMINSHQYTAKNVASLEKIQLFRISIVYPCEATTVPLQAVPTIIANVSSSSTQDTIFWETMNSQFVNFRVYNNGELIANLDNSTSQYVYDDSKMICQNNVNYQVIGTTVNNIVSKSNTITISPNSNSRPNPRPMDQVAASIENNAIKIFWSDPPTIAKNYNIYRSDNSGALEQIASIQPETQYIDTNVDVENTLYSYKIELVDDCEKVPNEPIAVSPIFLKMNTYTGKIEWSSYVGHGGEIQEYYLEKYDENYSYITTVYAGQNTYHYENWDESETGIVYYRIKGQVENIEQRVYSNFSRMIFEAEIHCPNAFTPNGDGLNDTFFCRIKSVESGSMWIFNRWGRIIFYTDDIVNGAWDGYWGDDVVASGTYTYKISYIDKSGIPHVTSGSITVIR